MSVASTSEGSSAAATLQQQPPPPPPATIYPPLLGTLAATTATSVSQGSTLGNKHTTTPSESPVSSVRVHSTERVNNQQMTNEQPATHAVLEDISYCSTYPRKDGISNSAVATGNRVLAGGIVSEIESFTSSSIVHQTISDQNIIQQSRHILDHSTDTSMHGDVVLSLPDSQDESRVDEDAFGRSEYSSMQASTSADATDQSRSRSKPQSGHFAALPTPASNPGSGRTKSSSNGRHTLDDHRSASISEPRVTGQTDAQTPSTVIEESPGSSHSVERIQRIPTSSRSTSASTKKHSDSNYAVVIEQQPVTKKQKRSVGEKSSDKARTTTSNQQTLTVPEFSDDPLGMVEHELKQTHRTVDHIPPSSDAGTDYDNPPHAHLKSNRSASTSVPAAAKGKKTKKSSKAVSDDEFLEKQFEDKVQKDRERAEDDDEDYGKGGRKTSIKGKRKLSKRASSSSSKNEKGFAEAPPPRKTLTRSDRTISMSTTNLGASTDPMPVQGSSISRDEVMDAGKPVRTAPTGVIAMDIEEDDDEDEAVSTAVVVPARLHALVSRSKSRSTPIIETSDEDEEALMVTGTGQAVDPVESDPRAVSAPSTSIAAKSRSRKRAIGSDEDEDEKEMQVDAGPVAVKSGSALVSVGKNAIGRGRKSVNDGVDAASRAVEAAGDDTVLPGDKLEREDEAGDADDESDDGELENAGKEKSKGKENHAPPALKSALQPAAQACSSTGNANKTQLATASATKAFKKPRGLAGLLDKKGLHAHRPPGLSARAKVPRLHVNLKPPPPPKAALPKEKVRQKKGHEIYSDEEKPWYERKDPEEWDSDDHRRWKKRQNRLDRGLASDSGDDG